MKMMKALNLQGIGNLRYEDVPRPIPAADEVLLRVKAVGICGSDIPRVFTKGTYHFPTIIGHEFAGEIVESADERLIGHGAAAFPLLPCHECPACQAGNYAQCSHYDYYGSRRDGAMAEYIAVKRKNLVLMPAGVSYKAAAMSEPAAVACHAFQKTQVGRGDTLVIFGVGTIALLIASWARKSGVKQIVLAARSQEKVEFARKLGFEQTIDLNRTDVQQYIQQITDGRGADACIEGTGDSAPLELCCLCTRNFGRIVTLGNPAGNMQLSQQAYWQILRRELQMVGTWNSSFNERQNDWQAVMNAMQQKTLDAEALITHEFALDQYEEAFSIMRDKKELYCKVMFVDGEDKK